jgi:hypothetical protein
MAVGIEHKDKDSLMDAFDYFDMPCFAIYAGTQQRTGFCCESVADAREKFEQFVDFVISSGNQAVYVVRFYPSGTKAITNKTAYEGSTSFMMNKEAPLKMENGVMVIDRGEGKAAAASNNNFTAMIMGRLDKMEEQNRQLQQQLFNTQLKSLEEKMNRAINGTDAQVPVKEWWEQALEHLEKNPNAVGNIINPIKDAIAEFLPGKRTNYIQNPTTPVGRTDAREQPKEQPKETVMEKEQTAPATEEQETEEEEIDLFAPDAAGYRHNPLLTEDERKLPEGKQTEVIVKKLELLSDEQHEDMQNAAMDSVANRIGNPTLSRMIIAVACMNDKQMNKLLNHLD